MDYIAKEFYSRKEIVMGYLKTMVDVMTTEMNAIRCLIDEAGIEYESIVSEIANCEGKVIFMGVGKSAHIGKKLALHLLVLVHLAFCTCNRGSAWRFRND